MDRDSVGTVEDLHASAKALSTGLTNLLDVKRTP